MYLSILIGLSQWRQRISTWWRNLVDPMGVSASFYGQDLTEQQWNNQAMYRVKQIHEEAARHRYYRQQALNSKHPGAPVITFYGHKK